MVEDTGGPVDGEMAQGCAFIPGARRSGGSPPAIWREELGRGAAAGVEEVGQVGLCFVLGNAGITPALEDGIPVVLRVLVEHDDDVKVWERFGEAAEPRGGLLEGQVDVQEGEVGVARAGQPYRLKHRLRFTNHGTVPMLCKHAADGLTHVSALIRDEDAEGLDSGA